MYTSEKHMNICQDKISEAFFLLAPKFSFDIEVIDKFLFELDICRKCIDLSTINRQELEDCLRRDYISDEMKDEIFKELRMRDEDKKGQEDDMRYY